MDQVLKTTALHAVHKKLKARMVPFGGWDMPVQYEGVIAEHKHVRDACGVFDVSHMGEIFISGSDALPFLQLLTINDVSRLQVGDGQYSALVNFEGGFVDDLILYRIDREGYLLCVNASNILKDFEWLCSQQRDFHVSLENQSSQWSQLAVQGPRSEDAMRAVFSSSEYANIASLAYTGICRVAIGGTSAFVARTGYTGEKGYEIYLPHSVAERVFTSLLELEFVKPIGLGARDTLRLESSYLLYGNDMNEGVSPIEAGISWAVRFDKGDFIAREILLAQKEGKKPARRMFAFLMEDDGIARHGMPVFHEGQHIGEITSGSFLPSLDAAGGLLLIDAGNLKISDHVEIDIRGKRKLAKLVRRPLYSAKVK